MYIRKVHLKDYKRFHDLTIDLGPSPKRLIALVGPNGCGKSSVFDAMIFLAQQYIGTIGSSKNNYDYHYHSLVQSPNVGSENVHIEFTNGDFSNVNMALQKKGKERSVFSFRSSFRYNASLKIKETRAVSDILKNNYGASSASDIDQRIEEGYRRLLAKYNSYMEEHDARPSETKEHILGELNKSLNACLDLTLVSLGNVNGDEGSLYFQKKDSPIKFEYNVLSAGEKEVVDLLLDLYLRRDSYTDSIYLIDEPELHLSTAIQRALLSEINKLIPNDCQIWIATHSIGFLRAIQNELKEQSQIIEFDPSNQWASKSYILYPAVSSRAMWQRLFATALDDLCNLICPKTIIYCEGKDKPKQGGEEQGLDAEVYNTIFNQEFPDVLFVSSGGNTELDQRSQIAILILTKVFPELNVLVLKDRDMASGKITDEKSRLSYLSNNPNSHRVLKRFEIENYLYDKEILKKYCADVESKFDEGSYDLFVTDIVNQNLKDATGRIKNFCGLTVSVNKDTFKKNLSKYVTKDTAVYEELKQVIFQRM